MNHDRRLVPGLVILLREKRAQIVSREPGGHVKKPLFWVEALEDTILGYSKVRAGSMFRLHYATIARAPRLGEAPLKRWSVYPGVTWEERRKRWLAYGYRNGVRAFLGYWLEEIDAAKAARRFRERLAAFKDTESER